MSHRWHRIEDLYHRALACDDSQRSAFLRDACGDDEALRQEVESLLEHYRNAESLMETPAIDVAARSLATDNARMRDGQQVGSYTILSLIGIGGMGEVYRARHSKLERDVALKVLPAHLSQDPERMRRSEHEAKTLASLNHANIAAIYDLVESDGIQCLVLEYVEGQTLAQRLKRGHLSTTESLDIARQIAEGLESAHERGIIHRDLKPSNVMITADGKVKVLDFGIARILESEAPADAAAMARSATGAVVMGTPAYMSPEQAKGHNANRTSDVWAFGCVLYEMLTGMRAFNGDSPAEILDRVAQMEPDWNALPDETPSEIRKLVQRCLRKDAQQRLQNIGDARIEIDDARRGPQTHEQLTQRSVGGRRRIRLISAFALVTVIALVMAVRAFRSGPPPPEMRLEITTPPTIAPWSLAISPDGQMIVFAATVGSENRLWLRPLSSGPARQLAGTDNAYLPFWSPDGRSIGFFADGKLKRIGIDGGVPQVLANAPLAKGGAWSRTGVILFAPNNSGPIFRIPAAGGQMEAVTQMREGSTTHRFPQFLPDGRHFLYWAGAEGAVYVATLDGPETRRVLKRSTPIGGSAEYTTGRLVFQRQTTLFSQRFDPVRLELMGDPSPVADHVPDASWSVSEAGPIIYRTGPATYGPQREFVWFDGSGKMLEQVGDDSVNVALGLSMSSDGQHLAVGRLGSIWLLELARAALTRFTRQSWIAAYPIWSPDGSRIVFGHYERGTAMDLYQKKTNGGGTEELLLRTPLNKSATDWSSDGRFLLYRSSDPKTGVDIWALPMSGANASPVGRSDQALDGDRKPFAVVQTDDDERDGQFSPNGKWIAYQSNESGRFQIYAQPFPGPGTKKLISTNGGAQVRWRRDGRELFYIGLDGRLMAVPIRFSADGKTIELAAAVPLFPTRVGDPLEERQQYSVSPDGQRFLMNIVSEEAAISPVTVILNYKPK
jgi:serine/threonine protein kinase/Tol biopolymer transport system component